MQILKSGIVLFVCVYQIFSLDVTLFAQSALPGKIKGTVVDRATMSPVPSANIVVVGQQRGAAADLDGNFVVENLPPGIYHIRASALGFEPATISEILVQPDRTATIDFRLSPTLLKAWRTSFP